MNWYRKFKKQAMPLDPDSWKRDERPSRFQNDMETVKMPFGLGTIRQNQDPQKLEERYRGVHFTYSPEMAAMYASGKATANDPPVIIEINPEGMQMELDADGTVNYEVDTYVQENSAQWRQWLSELDAQKLTAEQFQDNLIDKLQGDVDWGSDDGDFNDASDFVTRYNRDSAASIIKSEIEELNPEQVVQKIQDTLTVGVPKEWYIRAVNQFRVLNAVESNNVKGIYEVPWINFNEIYPGVLYEADSERLEELNYTKQDDVVVDENGLIILDYEDVDFGNWLSKVTIYENPNIQGDSVWHGTSLKRAQQSFPELLGVQTIAGSDKWYKTSKEVQSIEQIATQVRNSLMQDDDDSLKSLCLPVSRHLAQVLINNGYVAANVVQGTFTIDNPDPSAYEGWDEKDFLGDSLDEDEAMEEGRENMESAKYTPLHYWVQINNIVIDITADQFNDELEEPMERVEIGDIVSLGRYTVITENWIEPKIMYSWAVQNG